MVGALRGWLRRRKARRRARWLWHTDQATAQAHDQHDLGADW